MSQAKPLMGLSRKADQAGHVPAFALPVLGALTLVRLVVAATVPLAPDEAYYWVWSHALSPGYLDHPPMVALWIGAGTAVAGQTALGVRLLGPLATALASWLLLDAGRCLFNDVRAGLLAVLLLNGTLLLGVGSVIMTPDSPLLFFWTAGLWAVARLAAGGHPVWWLVAGACGGLAMDSKYTGLFLWTGVALWVLWVPRLRPWLRRWHPWAACGIGLLLFAPVLAWNARHGWAGLARQGGRVGDWRPGRAAGYLGELLGGQLGLATPLIFLLCIIGLIIACRQTWRGRSPAWSLLCLLSLPPALVFLQHAFGDRVQGNWPAILYPALSLAAGATVVAYSDGSQALHSLPAALCRHWRAAAALGYAITALAYLQATSGLIPLPPRLDPVALRLAGWAGLADQTAALVRQTDAAYVAAEGYALGSELAWSLPSGIQVLGLDTHWSFTRLPRAALTGQPGLLLRDARDAAVPDPAAWREARLVGTLSRPGAPSGPYKVYRVIAERPSAVLLPRRQ